MDIPEVNKAPSVRSTGFPPDGSASVVDSGKGVDPSENLEPEEGPGPDLASHLEPEREPLRESEPGNSIDSFLPPQPITNAATFVVSPAAIEPTSQVQEGGGAGVKTALVILLVALVIAAGSFAIREGAWEAMQAESRALWESIGE
jgi:hypothetical protein